MIPKSCKCLAEVNFPIAVVSRHSAREKYTAEGHPNTLHMWWARRPLAACRAMLLTLLLPDPCDPECLVDFKNKREHCCRAFQELCLRKAISHCAAPSFGFIGDFANWDLPRTRPIWKSGTGW